MTGAEPDQAELELLLRISAIVNRSRVEGSGADEEVLGDPTDVALWEWCSAMGGDPEAVRTTFVVSDEVPFSSDRMLAAALGGDGAEEPEWLVKGAPEKILERCDSLFMDGVVAPLDAERRTEILKRNEALAQDGLRVLGFSVGPAGLGRRLQGMTFVGLVGLLDPPAPGVAETGRTFIDAGIRTVVVTGDQRSTAETVARRAGFLSEHGVAVDARDIQKLTDGELDALLRDVVVLARVAPVDKLRVVEALQRSNQIVAMLGDGVNDAAALKRADVGVAMGGRGADVAKEASDIILRDDQLRHDRRGHRGRPRHLREHPQVHLLPLQL